MTGPHGNLYFDAQNNQVGLFYDWLSKFTYIPTPLFTVRVAWNIHLFWLVRESIASFLEVGFQLQ